MTGSNLLHASAAVTAQLDNHEKLLAPVRRDQAVREWLESMSVCCPHCAYLQPPHKCYCCEGKKEVSLRHFLRCEDCREEIEERDGEDGYSAQVGAAIIRAAEAI